MKPGAFAVASLGAPLAFGCSNVSGTPGDMGQSCLMPLAVDGGNIDSAADGGNAGGAGEAGAASGCSPGDSDGINGSCYAFVLTVNDTGFSPIILKAQNLAQVTLTLKNTGTKPHDFSAGCIATANLNGCPPQTCFPAAAAISAVPAGGSSTATFITPNPEGIYIFRSDLPGDSQVASDGGVSGLWGQFVVQ
jgi:hypothetical protein